MTPPASNWPLPPGAWDCHAHVFGSEDAYPLQRRGPGSANTGASVEALMATHRGLGIFRGRLVQPVEYGTDYSYLMHALVVGHGAYAGAAMADPGLDMTALKRLAAGGVKALRFMFIDPMGLTPTRAALMDGVRQARELGWRLRILGNPISHAELFEALSTVDDVPILLEHMAVVGPDAASDPRLRAFLARPNVWLMMSAGHRRSKEGPPWRDMTLVGRALYAIAPTRRIWGSDWPYLGAGPKIPEADALRLLASYLPNEAAWRGVMAANPAAFTARPAPSAPLRG